jgi:hypothetical protein
MKTKIEKIESIVKSLKEEIHKIQETSDLEFKKSLEDKLEEFNEIIENKKEQSLSYYYFNLLAKNDEQYDRLFVTIPDIQKFHFGPKDEQSLFLWISNNQLNKLTDQINGFPCLYKIERKKKPILKQFDTDYFKFKLDSICTSHEASFDIQNNNDQIYYYIQLTLVQICPNYQELEQVLLDLVDFLDSYYINEFKHDNDIK